MNKRKLLRSKPEINHQTIKRANQALRKKYKVEGYPTVIALDADGKKIGELGYVAGGPKASIAKFEKETKTKSKS